jgi:geranylgeranyl pyrophosphate synthase
VTFEAWATDRRALVERELMEALSLADAPARLREAMRYAVLGGGKRLRPLLCLGAAEAVGTDPSAALPAAAAIELVHAYSLVHDDLPSMDDDDFRRGRPSCHRAFDEATAVLAGDALLTLAFEVACERTRPPERAPAVALAIARAAGAAGMAGGQALDVEAEGRELSLDALERLYGLKTGALFEGSVRAGALAAGASEGELARLADYARAFGIAFQIVDDVLDVVADARGVPALLGVEAARARARELATKAVEALGVFGPAADPLRELVRVGVERDR